MSRSLSEAATMTALTLAALWVSALAVMILLRAGPVVWAVWINAGGIAIAVTGLVNIFTGPPRQRRPSRLAYSVHDEADAYEQGWSGYRPDRLQEIEKRIERENT